MKTQEYKTQMTLGQVCEILEVQLPEEYMGMKDDILTNMSYHTNFLRPGGAFFIRGKDEADVDAKIQQAINEGIKFIFINTEFADRPLLQSIPHIAIEKPFQAVIKVSAKIRDDLGIKVVGVTGSLGKTTTKDMIHNVLKQGHTAKKSMGNQNTIYPIFNNMQRMPHDTEFYIQEFGIKMKNVMPNTVKACVPNVGVITNISDPHVDTFGSKKGIMREKLRMIKRMPAGCPAFLNYDDPLLSKAVLEDHPIISYAIDNRKADYYATDIKEVGDTITFNIVHNKKSVKAQLNTRGRYNIGNALVAYAVGDYFGIDSESMIKGIAEYKGSGIRQNFTNVGGYNLYIDCYNTAPVSLVDSVDVLCKMPYKEGGRKVAVIADIYRLGDQAERLHTECGQKIGQSDVDLVFCYGNEYAEIMHNELVKAGKKSFYTANRDELNEMIASTVTTNDVILFKGPVPRLLSKTIDQVFGTGLHITSEHYTDQNDGDYRTRVIRESEDETSTTGAILKYNGTASYVEIPTSTEGVDIIAIGTKAFFRNRDLKEVTVPAPVFNLSMSAFSGCRSLEKVVLPETLKFIGPSVFRNCKSLTELVLPEGVIEIGNHAFRGCSELTYLKIPSTVGRIGNQAFDDADKLVIDYSENEYARKYIKQFYPEKYTPAEGEDMNEDFEEKLIYPEVKEEKKASEGKLSSFFKKLFK